jgi:hypothetical protein
VAVEARCSKGRSRRTAVYLEFGSCGGCGATDENSVTIIGWTDGKAVGRGCPDVRGSSCTIIRATEEGTGTDTVEDVLVFTTAGTEGCSGRTHRCAKDGGTCVTESNLAKGTRGRACCSEDVS